MKTAQILDDLAQMAGGAVSIAGGVREQIRQDIKSRVEEMADRLDLVPRSEFERLEVMLREARLQQNEMLKRLEELENKNTSKKAPKGKK